MKRLLFAFLLVLLGLPALQLLRPLLPEAELAGVVTKVPEPELSLAGLLENNYQPAFDQYVQDNLGFRTWLIKARNQLAFSLFQVSHYSYALIGQQGMIFQPQPVDAYLGKDFIGEEEIRRRVKRLRVVQQDLAARGIPMLLLMAPNKARFMPELLPARLPHPEPGHSNYEVFIAEMQRQHVEMLNLTPLFDRWKDTASYPLFPWGGTHWSAYGATLSADTLLNRVEALVKSPVPRLHKVGPPIITNDAVKAIDEDLSRPMNLLRPLKGYAAVYPRLGPAPARPGEKRPNLLLVGDSFGWGLMCFSPFIQYSFAPDTRFWYYNRTVHLPDSIEHPEPGVDRATLNLRQQVESRDIVVVLLTELNLPTAELGLTNQLFDLYHPLSPAEQARLAQIRDEISHKASWEEANEPGFAAKADQQAHIIFDKEREARY